MIIRHPSTLAEVASALGISTNNARDLFTTSNIKINNFYKPCPSKLNFGSGEKGSLSDDERRAANWGWGNLGGPDNSSHNLRLALRNKGQGKAWSKVLPSGTIGVSPYRLGDFNNYNTEPSMPFLMTLDKTECSTGDSLRIYVENNSDELLNLQRWDFFSDIDDYNKIGFGVFCTNSSTNSISEGSQFTVCMIASYHGLTITDVLGNDKGFTIPSGYLEAVGISTGTCYITPFLIKDTSDMQYSDLTTLAVVCDSTKIGAMIFLQDRLSVTITGTGGGGQIPSLDDASIAVNSISYSYNDDGTISLDSITYTVTFNSSDVTKVALDLRAETGMLGDETWNTQSRTVTSAGSYTESFGGITLERGAEARIQYKKSIWKSTAVSAITSDWLSGGSVGDY